MSEYAFSSEPGFTGEPISENKSNKVKSLKNISLAIVILLLSVVSILGSADGFLLLLSSGDTGTIVELAAGIMSGVIVILQLASLASFGVSRDPIFLVVYFCLMALSATTGSSYYGRKLGLVDEAVQAELSDVLDDKLYEISLFYNDLSGVDTQLSRLLERSVYMVKQESAKCWDRCNERKSDRDTISLLSDQLNKQVNTINAQIRAAKTSPDAPTRAANIKELSATAALYSSSDNRTIVDLSAYLDEVILKYRTGQSPSAKWLGKDPEMVRLAEDVKSRVTSIRSISRKVELPNTGATASLERSVGVMKKVFSGKFKAVTQNEWYSLCIAVIIDLLILYASVMLKITNSVKDKAKGAMMESEFNLKLFSKVMRTAQLKTPMDLIRTVEGNLLKQSDDLLYLAPRQDTRCYTLMSTLEALQFVRKHYTNELEYKVRERLKLPANRYVFTLPVRTWQEMKKAGFQMAA